eukprot:6137810-Pleurochrysis_carterae.AAC.3
MIKLLVCGKNGVKGDLKEYERWQEIRTGPKGSETLVAREARTLLRDGGYILAEATRSRGRTGATAKRLRVMSRTRAAADERAAAEAERRHRLQPALVERTRACAHPRAQS